MQSSGLAGQRWQQEMKNGIRRQEGQGDTQLGFRSTALTAALPGVCCHQGGGTKVVKAEPSAACGSSMGVCLETAIVWEKCLLTWVWFPDTATKTCVATQGCREVSWGYTQFSPSPVLDAAPREWGCRASAPVASTPLPGTELKDRAAAGHSPFLTHQEHSGSY